MFKCETNHQRFESFLKLNGLVDHDWRLPQGRDFWAILEGVSKSHEHVGSVPPRFSWGNWTFVNNPRSQPLKVLFLPRINQIWPAQSSHRPSNEISFGDFSERTMIIRMIPRQISGYQRAIRYSPESFSGL
jgi:hypothetical protein